MRKKTLNPVPFWRVPKIQDLTHPDYRPSSPDLPLLSGEWKFNIAAYESDLADMNKSQRNLSKLEPGIHPNQKV